MNARDEAAWEVHTFLTPRGVSYVIIGGVAVQHWGEPRFTLDVDVTVMAPLNDLDSLVQTIVAQFPSRIEDPIAFARTTRVIPIRASNGCPVDISLALPGYEDEVMHRTVDYELEPGKVVKLCSAEDLIIHKAVAGRPQDLRDIEGVVYRQRDALDADYIQRWPGEFATVMAAPDLPDRFEQPWRRIHP